MPGPHRRAITITKNISEIREKHFAESQHSNQKRSVCLNSGIASTNQYQIGKNQSPVTGMAELAWLQDEAVRRRAIFNIPNKRNDNQDK